MEGPKARMLLPKSTPARYTRLAVALGAVGLLSGCLAPPAEPPGPELTPVIDGQPTVMNLRDMKARNSSGHVDPLFESHPKVLAEEYGLATSELLFRRSDGVIIADQTTSSQLRAASLAVFAHVPMLTFDESHRADIIAEIQRLNARRVLLIGDVPLAETSGTPLVFRDPGGLEALGKLTAHQFEERLVTDRDDFVQEVTKLDGSPVVLVPGWEPVEKPEIDELPALLVQTRRDGLNAPVTVATSATPIASVANAQAYGADVRFLDEPDPRKSHTAFAAMAGLQDQPLLALGVQFGTDASLSEAIRQAEEEITRTGER